MNRDEPRTDFFLSGAAGGHGFDNHPTRAADAISSHQQIGPYTIQKVIGRGGMGTVYLAHDSRAKRDVALKVIPAGPDADQTDLARFRAEAEAVAKLNHPNIVRLYEVGQTADLAYLSMEYVDGGTLYRHIKRGERVDPIDAARLVEKVARAIHYAHQHGVIHRDLKPSNILLAKSDAPLGEQSPKLADFGLAKQLDRSLRLTQTGMAVGTPHYMAPEQARGEAVVGPAIDIHGLGGILYELLTGSPPFMGEGAAATMEQVVHKEPVAPSRLRQGIPSTLEAICLKCLEKDPRRRYRSAAALADDLRRFIDEPNAALRIERSQRWRRVLAVAGIAAVVIILVAMIAAAITTRFNRSEIDSLREQADAAIRAEQRARLESAIAMCEAGDVRLGIDRMRELEGAGELPVDKIIAAWQGRILEPVRTIPDLRASVFAMSPHGNRLATAEADRVRIWQTGDWTVLGEGWRVDSAVTALGWSENGKQLAIGTLSGNVFIANVESKQLSPEPIVERPGSPIAAVGFTFPGIRVVYAGETLRQEFIPPLQVTADKPHPFNIDDGPFTGVGIALMTGDAAAVTSIGSVRVYDSVDHRWRDLPPDGDVTAVAYSSDGNIIVTGTQSGKVRVWDAIARVPLTDTASIGGRIVTLAVSHDTASYTVIANPENGPATVLQCGRPWVAPPIRLTNRPGKEVVAVDFSSDGSKLFVTSPSGVSLWRVRDAKRYGPDRDYTSGEQYGRPAGPSARFSAGATGPNETIVVGGSGGKMFVVDSRDGSTVRQSGEHREEKEVTAVVVGPKGEVAGAIKDVDQGRSEIRHWTKEGHSRVREVPCVVNQEAYLPDGSAVLLACDDGYVRVWDPTRNEFRHNLECGSPVLSVAVSSDGKYVIAGCHDGWARLFDLATSKLIRTFRHGAEVQGVAFYKDRVLTAGTDGSARRWHIESGLPIGPPMLHPDAIAALAVRDDLLATGGRGRYVRVWRIDR